MNIFRTKITSSGWVGILLITLAFLIPSVKKLAPPIIVLLGIAALVDSIQKRRIYFSRRLAPLYLLAVLFLLHLTGLLYSENYEYGLTEIGIKLSFIGFPLIALFLPEQSSEQYRKIKWAFVYGCLAYLVGSILLGIYHAVLNQDFLYLSYEKLSHPYHPTYAASYQAMAFFILLQFSSKQQFLFKNKIAHYISLIAIIIFVSMLASKAGLIALWISAGMAVFFFKSERQKFIRKAFLFLLFIILSISSSYLLPGTSTRIENAVSDLQNQKSTTVSITEQSEAETSTSLRFVTWSASWELIKNNPIGVGTGDTTDELIKVYEKTGEFHAAEKELNSHNQFLQVGTELGWPGIIVFTAILLSLLFLLYNERDLLLLNFLLICTMNFLFESFLEVQAGIVFFCFWVLIFTQKRRVDNASQLSSESL